MKIDKKLLSDYTLFDNQTILSCHLLAHQGYCNENYIITTDKNKYLLRKLLRDDIDRQNEYKIHHLAYEIAITAKPLLYDEVNQIMIFSFLEGKHKETLDVHELKDLAEVLKKLHNIDHEGKPTALEIQKHTTTITKAFKTIENYPKEYVLCHNDLNPKNIFFSYDIKFIDWEYAGLNDRYFDLACVCVEFSLDEEMQEIFLKAYFSKRYFKEKLESYKIIYKTLCEEWFKT
ncbi:MAG: choline/ethanolamine kinase family protein [Campylobacterota bacterium]|nr:choline/ethanolamine kinase family protein [Campylobacterota bacterium]